MGNTNLHAAKAAKNDEFYTQLSDIEKELQYYKEHLKGKYIYCNCDSIESNFYIYFKNNFNSLGLKHLTVTGFRRNGGEGERIDYDGENETVTAPYDGDFRANVDILKEADIVVSNPPFSLFREYVAQLVEYGKKFLIIGNNNAVTYKEIFPLIKENKLWLGYTSPKDFVEPNNNVKKFGNILWYTNLEHKKRHEPLDLYKRYSNEYPKYDNYDAIEVSKTCDIPVDYEGIMGVPITFLMFHCPEQFEIVGLMSGAKGENLVNGNDGRVKFYVNGKPTYARILIRKK